MTEFGLFNSEGCLARGMYSEAEAELLGSEAEFAEEDGLAVYPMCPCGAEFAEGSCEECDEEEADEEEAAS